MNVGFGPEGDRWDRRLEEKDQAREKKKPFLSSKVPIGLPSAAHCACRAHERTSATRARVPRRFVRTRGIHVKSA
jgi:hypothetical protein